MAIAREQTDLLLDDLESRVRQRVGWRGSARFYQALEYELQPILDTAADPGHVRAWTRAMLVRNGHPVDPLDMAGGSIDPGDPLLDSDLHAMDV